MQCSELQSYGFNWTTFMNWDSKRCKGNWMSKLNVSLHRFKQANKRPLSCYSSCTCRITVRQYAINIIKRHLSMCTIVYSNIYLTLTFNFVILSPNNLIDSWWTCPTNLHIITWAPGRQSQRQWSKLMMIPPSALLGTDFVALQWLKDWT